MTVQQFNEPAGGQVVFHLHFHILPRFDGVALKPHTGQMEKPEILAANAEKITRGTRSVAEIEANAENRFGDDDAEQNLAADEEVGGEADRRREHPQGQREFCRRTGRKADEIADDRRHQRGRDGAHQDSISASSRMRPPR